jgi:hypothetical protein
MEIKTEYNIFWNHNHQDENQRKKKWVSVDELIEELEDLHEMRRLELIKQLKGEENGN